MGMFDNVLLGKDVALPGPQPHLRLFQSKDLDCGLDTYRITNEGRLVRDDKGGNVDINFHGVLNFYTYDDGDSRPEDESVTPRWHDYNAKFTDGKLVSIERVEKRCD